MNSGSLSIPLEDQGLLMLVADGIAEIGILFADSEALINELCELL